MLTFARHTTLYYVFMTESMPSNESLNSTNQYLYLDTHHNNLCRVQQHMHHKIIKCTHCEIFDGYISSMFVYIYAMDNLLIKCINMYKLLPQNVFAPE